MYCLYLSEKKVVDFNTTKPIWLPAWPVCKHLRAVRVYTPKLDLSDNDFPSVKYMRHCSASVIVVRQICISSGFDI